MESRGNDQQRAKGLDLADFILNEPPIVKTIAEWVARPGSICKPDESQLERLQVEPCDPYPAEWDAPNPPDAVPTIKLLAYADEQLISECENLPDWYVAFGMPWRWDASTIIDRVRWMVLPLGVVEGSAQDQHYLQNTTQ